MKKLNRNMLIIVLCLLISAILFPKNTLALSVPSTPTNFTATAASSSQINLTWDAIGDATSYYLYMSTAYNGTYNNIAVTTSPSYTHTGLSTNATYYYKVQAFNNAGLGALSSITYATTTNTTTAYGAPSIPTNLTATAASSGQINLTWDSISGATSYYLYMATSYYGTYSNIAVTTSPSYANTGLSTNGTYYYKVQAFNNVGLSGFSAVAYATTTNFSYGIPSIPTNLTATPAGAGQINLTWDSISGATSYYLYMSTSYYGTYSNIAVLTSTSYANTGLSTNGTYYYKVQAFDSAGLSGFSAIAYATATNTNTSYSVPLSPTNLTATAASPNQINLTWDAMSGATTYYLYMASSYYGNYSNIAVLTSPSYAHTGLSTNVTYYYKVQASNSAGLSGFSAIADAMTTNTSYSVPSIPTNLTATTASSSQINLTWDAISGATSYYLYMASSYNGTYSNIAVLTSPSYAHTGLSTNSTYYYEVQAVNSAGSSGFSAIASATTSNTADNILSTPTNLTATAAGSSQINLTWDAISGATSYNIYRATSSSGTFANIVAVTTAGYVDTALSSGTTYYYEVQAVNSAGTSSYSSEAFTTTTSDGTTSTTAPPDSSSTQIQSNRLAGQDRYETAAEITKSWWKTSYYAIIASGDTFADALCGAPLATKYNAPILLSSKDSIEEPTKLQLSSLKVKQVFIIGGVGVISTNVEQEIKNMGIVVTRLAGNDRYATSLKVAQAMGKFNQAVIATGEDFPDALSIAPIAAMKGIPIILTPKDNLPAGLKDYLNKTVQNTYVVGGVGVVSDNVFNQLPSPMRLSGIDRYETNLSIIKEFSTDLNFANCYLATGEDFPDALAGSALAASTSSPIILVSDPVEQSTQDFVNSKTGSISKIIVFGGIAAVPDSILNSFDASSTSIGSDAPSTPTNITATTVSSSQIKLTWDSVSGATSYNVYGATSSSGTFSNIATVTSSSYSNSGLWAGTTYYYKVQAVNSAGSSSFSPIAYATTAVSNS
ncbi:Cell wall-binding protein [Candidatus Desulfosporosinus infrequens]|uniref:Cell wall-binding protein n=1 Tax=Candidatus Desulfosporosinus infrequens TaxID=2043169 RepID=A0A2U3L269_9FIRM|nr:Cell wall-binding protein [Candidatus Desulfosporosinus infrequens]